MPRVMSPIVLSLLALAGSLLAPGVARASFAGENGGTIVYASVDPGGNWEIRSIGVDGGGETNLTQSALHEGTPA